MASASSRKLKRRRLAVVAAGLMLMALSALVALQARWLGELAIAQRDETRRVLQAAVERMARDFQGVLSEIQTAVTTDRLGGGSPVSELIAEVVPLGVGEAPESEAPAFVAFGSDGRRWLVVLELTQLQSVLFPALAEAALGDAGLETFRVSVVNRVEGRGPIFQTQAELGGDHRVPDASAELPFFANEWSGFFGDGESTWVGDGSPMFFLDEGSEAATLRGADSPSGGWRIEARHSSGSLDVALARAQRRNLLLVGGLLVLVLSGVVLLWVGEQRARRLAEKELAFVAGVSHELRTPLTVARTAASNLSRRVVVSPEQVSEYGQLIESEVERVSALVERVLRFSGGETALDLGAVSVRELIEAALERCRPWADRKRFRVDVNVANGVETVWGDEAALTSALHNLIENAVKYGDDGQTIEVSASGGDEWVLRVADSGPGVAVEDRKRIFEPFFRGSRRTEGAPGHGLGLAVASDIARAHGGRLELLPNPNGSTGATFAFSWPAVEPGAAH